MDNSSASLGQNENLLVVGLSVSDISGLRELASTGRIGGQAVPKVCDLLGCTRKVGLSPTVFRRCDVRKLAESHESPEQLAVYKLDILLDEDAQVLKAGLVMGELAELF